MSLTLEDVKHIANLARLELSADELECYLEQLSAILDHFQQLEKLDTDKVQPTATVSTSAPTLRFDHSQPGLSLDELQQNAPDFDERLFRVPPIFD